MNLNLINEIFAPTSSWVLDSLLAVGIFIFGACIGSFLNCVIYRLEEEKSLKGRSFCPHCKHMLAWHDLFPVFSFLFLGGKCRYCKAKISVQYPLVEISTGLIFLLIFNFKFFPIASLSRILDGSAVGTILNLFFLFYIASTLIIIFIYDLKHYLIPEVVLLPAVAITFIYQLLNFKLQILPYLLATFIAGGIFYLMYWLSKEKAMGFGDVELVVLMGFLLSWPNLILALFLAFFFGAIIGLALMIFEGKKLKSLIPFGPFLIAGTFIAMFFGNYIIQWYLNLVI